MNYLSITVFSLGTIFFMSCTGEPDCISQRINQFKLQESTCAGASIIKYQFEGQTVYGFGDGNCISDRGIAIIDEACNDVCFIGGIAGFTDCNGVNFAENAEEIEVLFSVK